MSFPDKQLPGPALTVCQLARIPYKMALKINGMNTTSELLPYRCPLVAGKWFSFFFFHDINGAIPSVATKQLCEWFSPSLHPSAHVSVTPFSLCFHHRIIMKLLLPMTEVMFMQEVKVRGQRSKVNITEVKTQFSCFWTITPVWIHIWWWNDAQSLMFLKIVFQGHLSNFKVTQLKKWLILTQIGRFQTVTLVWIHRWPWNDAQSFKQHGRGVLLFFKVIHQISRSHGQKKW